MFVCFLFGFVSFVIVGVFWVCFLLLLLFCLFFVVVFFWGWGVIDLFVVLG